MNTPLVISSTTLYVVAELKSFTTTFTSLEANKRELQTLRVSIISRISRSLATCVRFSQSSSGTRDDDGVSFKEGVVATWERVGEVMGSDGENTLCCCGCSLNFQPSSSRSMCSCVSPLKCSTTRTTGLSNLLVEVIRPAARVLMWVVV